MEELPHQQVYFATFCAQHEALVVVQKCRTVVYDASLEPRHEFFINGANVRAVTSYCTNAQQPTAPNAIVYASTESDLGVFVLTARFRQSPTYIPIGATVKRVHTVGALVACVSDYQVHLLDTERREVVETINTSYNPLGCVAANAKQQLVACPFNKRGMVSVFSVRHCTLRHFSAHYSDITQLRFSACGRYLATCSGRGTLIRIFDMQSLTCVNELRRGYETCTIVDMHFHPEHAVLYVVGDHGPGKQQTVHEFDYLRSETPVEEDEEHMTNSKTGESLSYTAWISSVVAPSPLSDMAAYLSSFVGGGTRAEVKHYVPDMDKRALCVFWYRHLNRLCVITDHAYYYLFPLSTAAATSAASTGEATRVLASTVYEDQCAREQPHASPRIATVPNPMQLSTQFITQHTMYHASIIEGTLL